jgi:predicted XRE-type DNA-binding protein
MKHLPRDQYNVFADLDFPPAEASNLLMRARLMMALTDLIEARSLTQVRAAALLGVTQPRISDLVRGKIDRFSVDCLLAMLSAAGATVEISVRHNGERLTPVATRAVAERTPPHRCPSSPGRARPRARSAG